MKLSFSRKFSVAWPLACVSVFACSLVGCSSQEGPSGATGQDGSSGEDGSPGADGSDGAVGSDGADGFRGRRGPRGSDGAPGQNGSPGEDGVEGSDAAARFDVRGVLAHEIAVGGAEMLDVSEDGRYVLVAGVDVATLLEVNPASLSHVATLTLPAENLPEGANAGEFTGMSIHPDGTYALIAVRDVEHDPAAGGEVQGKVLALSLPSLEVLSEVTVGIGPDSVDIAPNGLFAVVANEDEEDETDLTNPENRAGTISVIDLRNGPDELSQVEVPIPATGIPYFSHDPQPETVKVSSDSSFVLATLQENNAIARLDIPDPLPSPLTAGAFSVENWDAGVRTGLGLVSGSVGSEMCRPSAYDISLRQEYVSAREPDGVAITSDGLFFVTADEDNLTFTNGQMHDGELLSRNGARSISIYDATTGAFLGDSGNSIENAVIAKGLPQRCSSKGPEPEVVDVALVRGRQLAFVAIERSDAMTIHDVTDPANIRLLDLVVLNPAAPFFDEAAAYEPEGIVKIPGRDLVVVSNPAGEVVSLVELHFNTTVVGGGYVPGSGAPAIDCDSGPLPGEDDIVINEVQSNPNPDFVELYNNGAELIDLGSWKFIDNGALADAFIIPAGTTIAPGEFLVIEGSGSLIETPLKLPFGLGGADAAMLYTACDVLVDAYSWSEHVTTASRCPDGVGDFTAPTTPTKGAANSCE